MTTNIFPDTLQTRSTSHFIARVAPGQFWHRSSSCSTVIPITSDIMAP